jgi:hypothetical protein
VRATVHGEVTTRIVDSTTWRTTAPLYVQVDHGGGDVRQFTVPTDYDTDFASVPRITAWLIPRTGDYSPAAVAHDYLITHVLPADGLTSREVDEAFREIMRTLGVPGPRRWLMWAGVRWAAAFNKSRRAGWWRDLLPLLGVSLPVIPFVLPGVAGVLASQVLIWIVSLVLPRRSKPNSMRT